VSHCDRCRREREVPADPRREPRWRLRPAHPPRRLLADGSYSE